MGTPTSEYDNHAGIFARSKNANITIENIGDAHSENGYAIYAKIDDSEATITNDANEIVPAPWAGNTISIQNVAVKKFDNPNDETEDLVVSDHGIYAVSDTSDINIGAADPQNNSGIKDIYADGEGIYVRTSGGQVDIYAVGKIETRDDAIWVNSQGGHRPINITTRGAIKVEDWRGVVADRDERGDITIKTYGTITTLDDDGIRAVARDTGNVDITVNAVVDAASEGVRVRNEIDDSDYPPNDLSGKTLITLNANVSGDSEAVEIDHDALGIVSLTLGDDVILTGRGSEGVQIESTGDGAKIQIQGSSGNKIYAEEHGAELSSYRGDIDINTFDLIAGREADGILAESVGGNVDVRNIGNIYSGESGYYAINIDTRLEESALTGDGNISIQNIAISEFDPDLEDDLNALARSANGILAYSGTGSINIGAEDGLEENQIGEILTTGTGIKAVSTGGEIDISMNGDIEAGAVGINARSVGKGINIKTQSVTSGIDRAIIARIDEGQSDGEVADLTIDSMDGDIFGTVSATKFGNGKINLSLGDVTTSNATGGGKYPAAVYAFSGSNSTGVNIRTNNVSTEQGRAISILTSGAGPTYLKTMGALTAPSQAILVFQRPDEDVTIKTYGEITTTTSPGAAARDDGAVYVANFSNHADTNILIGENINSANSGVYRPRPSMILPGRGRLMAAAASALARF